MSGEKRPREGTGVRERLMDAAYTEVLAGHWGERRMIDVAATARVSRQTLYNVFGSKEGLLQAVVVREVTALLDTVEAMLAADGHDPAHAVSRTTRMVLLAARDNPLLRAVVTGDDQLLPVLTTRAAPLLDALRERIAWTLAEHCPQVPPATAEAVADVSLRLTVSYALQPVDPDQAAHRVETVVHGMLLVDREEARVTERPGRAERAEVLRAYMPRGRITSVPVRRPDRLVLLDHVARAFEPGVRYTEDQLNAVLRRYSADHVVLRRSLVDEGFMESDRTHYWRCGGTVDL